MTTATTHGRIVIDLIALHRDALAQAWADIGRLYYLQATGGELHAHKPLFLGANAPPCACFPCRVERAWRWWEPVRTRPPATPRPGGGT